MGRGTYRNFDVIVIGGGPAGAAAAISCQQHGLRTLVVESDAIPRERPGETLHPGVEVLFRLLGVDAQVRQAGFLRHTGHYVRRDGRVVLQPYGADARGQWLGFEAVRAELDAILAKRAADAGAEIIRPARALEPVLEGGRVIGVRTLAGAYGAEFLVDASGPVHWLQRRLSLPILEVSRRLMANYGWRMRESRVSEQDLPEFTVEDRGWTWRAPVKPSLDAWVSLTLEGCREERLDHARDVTWRIARPCAGDGYFLVGDAAFVLDPACSRGVLKALMSGILAAQAISQSKARAGDSKACRAGYCAWMERSFCVDATALIELYSQFDPAPSWLNSARDAVRYISMSPSE